jgi:hypothetical protein
MPPPDKTTESVSMEPIAVPVISTKEVSGGPTPLATGTVATTPEPNQPNIRLVVITPMVAIFIRFANTYFTTLVGLVGAGLISDAIPATDFVHLVGRCAQLSVAGAGFGLLKDIVTVFGRLENKYPLMTGSV